MFGETEVEEAHLHRYVDEMLTTGPTGRTQLHKQFEVSIKGSSMAHL